MSCFACVIRNFLNVIEMALFGAELCVASDGQKLKASASKGLIRELM
jgi:hypothetical protein